jgi:ribonuclease P protein component
MKHETDIPTEQTAQKKDDRVPGQNENSWRQEGAQKTASRRTQAPHRLTFKSVYRLKRRPEFQRLMRHGERRVGRYLCVDALPSSHPAAPRLGITASSKYGSSVERNRFKRLAREAFRRLRPQWALQDRPKLDLHIVPRQAAKGAPAPLIEAELAQLMALGKGR